jgi:muramoyltetrapeptide carboxypeptidase
MAPDLLKLVQEFDEKEGPFCSNDDEYRFNNLAKALLAEDSKAVWCIRGGYGSARIIPKLNNIAVPTNSKLFIGFSDITALHIFLNQQWGWCTVHGKVLQQFSEQHCDEASKEQMKSLLYGTQQLIYNDLQPLNEAAKQRNLPITSTITGGNLCIVESSIGTSWQLEPTGKILFLEEENERGYRVDRSLEHLLQAGLLKGVEAIILGEFIGGEESNGCNLVQNALQRFALNLPIPVLSYNLIGHGTSNQPLPLGTKSTITFSNKINLTCDTGVRTA